MNIKDEKIMKSIKHQRLFITGLSLLLFFSLVFNLFFVTLLLRPRIRSFGFLGAIKSVVQDKYTDLRKNNALFYDDMDPISTTDIVMLGDSLTSNARWDLLFPGIKLRNRGVSGDTTNDILNRLDPILNGNPALIFILVGTNDLGYGKNIQDTFISWKKIIQKLLSRLRPSQIIVLSLLPINRQIFKGNILLEDIKKLNLMMKEFTTQNALTFIDLYPLMLDDKGDLDAKFTIDGEHLSEKGYEVWKKSIESYIMKK